MAALENGTVFNFALTAFDTQGNISDFSKEICLEVIESTVSECRSSYSGDSSSDGGGGGGGGCFINTASYAPHIGIKRFYVLLIISGAFLACANRLRKSFKR